MAQWAVHVPHIGLGPFYTSNAVQTIDNENFLKGKCVLVSSGNIIHMSNF